MSLVYCPPDGTLVGPSYWLPTEPFDFVWGPFGCDQLRCRSCGQAVQSTIDDAKQFRRYRCACQSRDEYGYHLIGSDAGQLQPFVTAWHCAGHPRLALPVELDGIAVSAVGPFAQIVHQTLADPPFVAPGIKTPSFWVQRLYRLLPAAAQQAMVGQAVAAELSSAEPRVVRAATDFFFALPAAAGADQVAAVAERDRDRLRATPDPVSPKQSLYRRMLEAVEQRLAVEAGGAPADRAALALGRRALVAGEAGSDMIFRMATSDSTWFCEHAADIVRAQPDELDVVLEAMQDVPADGRARALHDLEAIDEATHDAVRDWREQHPALSDPG